jgi:hypothetical protein
MKRRLEGSLARHCVHIEHSAALLTEATNAVDVSIRMYCLETLTCNCRGTLTLESQPTPRFERFLDRWDASRLLRMAAGVVSERRRVVDIERAH